MNLIGPTPSSRALLREQGYASVAHIPVLINKDGTYPELPNRYLRARALREWAPRFGTGTAPAPARLNAVKLTVKSLDVIGKKLCYLHRWVEQEQRDLLSMTYDDLLDWQSQLSGQVENGTANAYVAEAAYYLTWLSLIPRGKDGTPIRPPFHVGVLEHKIDSHLGDGSRKRRFSVAGRVGQMGTRKKSITLPSDIAIQSWMRLMHVYSPVKGLMCEVSLDSGVRISELNCLPVDALPPRAEWRPAAGRVFFFIDQGVKGSKVSPDSPTALRPREISLSVATALRVEEYRQEARELQIRRWIRAAPDKAEKARREGKKPKRLWLSDHTNEPFTNDALSKTWAKAWKSILNQMPSEPQQWSSHRARHYFAVELLVNAAIYRASANGIDKPNLTWAEGIMRDEINLIVRPALGHLDERTTQLYLRAALIKLTERLGSPALRWQDTMDGEAE